MAIAKVIVNGSTRLDLTADTVTAENLLSPYTAHDKTGTQIVGTASGGGGGSSTDAQVIFYDYDGTVVESYTAAEFSELTALPNNPSHTGLVAQGWNWTLAQIQAYLTSYPDGIVNVGQMYITSSGATEIDVILKDSDLSPWLCLSLVGTVEIDWGDNSARNTATGADITYVNHTYPAPGNYTIKLYVVSGRVTFFHNSENYPGLMSIKSGSSSSRKYADDVIAIRIGANATIGNNAFNYCNALASITIPDGITSIGSYAFLNCRALTSITIPDGVTSIGKNAFAYCHSLTSITIPDGVTSIGDNAFSYCYDLTSITIPDRVTSIGSYAFNHCYALASITIPDGVTSIGSYAFRDCHSLTSIIIPDGVTSIGKYAFQNCYTLASITIPDGVTIIGDYAFSTCYALTSITIPDMVTSIGNSAFSNCYALTSITIPDGVTSIGNGAFSTCYALTSITIPDGVTSIGSSVFSYSDTLTSITIPDGVTSIGNSAFSNCYALTSITIPDGVTSIGTSTFTNCFSMEEYHLLPTTPPTLASTNAFTGIVAGTKIYVPAGCLEAYQTATNWSTYASYMEEESA